MKMGAPYRSDRNVAGLKVKTVRRREFSVVGFRRTVPGKTGGQRTGLHGQGRDRLEANDVEHDPQDAGQ